MMGRVIFPTKYATETRDYTIPFESLLTSGETVNTSGAVVGISVYSGTDANPSGMLNGGLVYAGSGITQSLTGGVAGVTYYLTATVTTSTGNVKTLGGFLTVLGGLV
jgi:hypothetical protein